MRTITFESEDGPVEFEIAENMPGAGVPREGRADAGNLIADEKLEDALQAIARVGNSLQRSMASMDFERAQATIGIRISAQGSIVIATTAAEATLSVTIFLGRAKP